MLDAVVGNRWSTCAATHGWEGWNSLSRRWSTIRIGVASGRGLPRPGAARKTLVLRQFRLCVEVLSVQPHEASNHGKFCGFPRLKGGAIS
jgi:hypothetical protein